MSVKRTVASFREWSAFGRDPGEKLLDCVGVFFAGTEPDGVVVGGELHEASAHDVLGQITATLKRDDAIPAGVHHKGRSVNGRQHVADVDLGNKPAKWGQLRSGQRCAFVTGRPAPETRLPRHGRGNVPHRGFAGAPDQRTQP